MTKEEKILEIESLTTTLKDVKNLYLTDIAGLNAMETSSLRRMCFKSGIKLSVVKNTLLERAMKDSGKDFGELKNLLKGNTSLMFSESGNTPAKVIKDFRKNHFFSSTKFRVFGAIFFIVERLLDDNTIRVLPESSLPP